MKEESSRENLSKLNIHKPGPDGMHLRAVGELGIVIARQFSLSSLKDHENLGSSMMSGKRQAPNPSLRYKKRIQRTIDWSLSCHFLGRL